MTTPPQQPGYPEQPTNPYGVPAYPGGAHPQQPGYPEPEYQQPEFPQPTYQHPAYPGQST
jgi:cell division protease FtsH